jgi:hypothetical protein
MEAAGLKVSDASYPCRHSGAGAALVREGGAAAAAAAAAGAAAGKRGAGGGPGWTAHGHQVGRPARGRDGSVNVAWLGWRGRLSAGGCSGGQARSTRLRPAGCRRHCPRSHLPPSFSAGACLQVQRSGRASASFGSRSAGLVGKQPRAGQTALSVAGRGRWLAGRGQPTRSGEPAGDAAIRPPGADGVSADARIIASQPPRRRATAGAEPPTSSVPRPWPPLLPDGLIYLLLLGVVACRLDRLARLVAQPPGLATKVDLVLLANATHHERIGDVEVLSGWAVGTEPCRRVRERRGSCWQLFSLGPQNEFWRPYNGLCDPPGGRSMLHVVVCYARARLSDGRPDQGPDRHDLDTFRQCPI